MKLIIYSDGGSRNNPGPAGFGYVIQDAHGRTVAARGEFIGDATNNVAEYRGMISAAAHALELGAKEVEFRVDSELLARQVSGQYRVKAPTLKPLIIELMSILRRIPSWSVTHVRREFNPEADELVNRAIDERGVVA